MPNHIKVYHIIPYIITYHIKSYHITLYYHLILPRDLTYWATVSYMDWPNERYSYFLLEKLREQTEYPNVNLQAVR